MKTRAITDPGSLASFTLVQETDSRTALTRGLKEYVEDLEFETFGGRLLRLANVFDTWASAESAAQYPSAAIAAPIVGRYDAAKFTPQPTQGRVEGKVLLSSSELVIDLQLAIWATDQKQRMGLVAMLERDLVCPVDFMYGLLLELPHYFNARALYEPLSLAYEDSSEDAIRGYRRAVMVLRASVPVIRVAEFPDMLPRSRVETVERGIVNPSGVVVAAGEVFAGHPDP